MIVWETMLRTLIGFSLLLFLVRLIGKKLLGEMTFFTYITGIAMGEIAGEAIINREITMLQLFAALSAWTALTILVEYISLKSGKARILLDGEPSILIKNGVIQTKELSKLRLNMDDLSMLLRNRDVFSIQDVDYAILEANGKLSIIVKPGLQSVARQDLQLQEQGTKRIPTGLIVDGRIMKENLREHSLSVEWLQAQLTIQGIASAKQVLFAELQSDGSLYIAKTSRH